MPLLLNPFLRSFFRSTLPAQCTPVQDYILLVPTTEVLLTTRDRESGTLYADLAGVDEFLGSHVLRVPNATVGQQMLGGRESRGKARQFTTFNGRTVVVKDAFVYSNKGFRSLNQAQLLNDFVYFPDVSEPQQWLIYFISKPLIGSLEPVSTIPPYLRDRTKPEVTAAPASGAGGMKKDIQSFNELLMVFPMIARQMQPGLEKLFQDFEIAFERFKPLPLPPPSPSSFRSGTSARSGKSSRASIRSSVNGDVYKQAADESEIRGFLESAINEAVDLFQRVDQSQLDLLASTTDLTGPAVDRLIERYVAEQLHDSTLFPRLCATTAMEDEELDMKILDMENVDLSQVGIPSLDLQEKKSLAKRITDGIMSFSKMATAKSPQTMVESLLETARTLTKPVSEPVVETVIPDTSSVKSGRSGKSTIKTEKTATVTMNADMLVSLLLVVVIRAKVPNLHASLRYMRNFIFVEDMEKGETGYVLSTLEAVLFHIAQDTTLTKASRKNEMLWSSVRSGNLKALKRFLEPDGDEDEEEEDDVELDGGSMSRQPSLLDLNGHASIEEEVEEDLRTDGEPSSTSNSEEANEVPGPTSALKKTVAECNSPRDSGVAINGTADEEANDEEPPPEDAVLPRRGSIMTHNRPHDQTNGSTAHVQMSDDQSVKTIPRQEPPKEGDNSTGDGPPTGPGGGESRSSLAKEGPPADDVFEPPASPTTGVSNILVEEVKAIARDDDADSLLSIQVPPRPGVNLTLPPPPRNIGTARFDIEDKPRYATVRNNNPILRTPSNASRPSLALSRTGTGDTTQSQQVDAYSVEKISKTTNAQGESILMMAIQERQPVVLQYLLDNPLYDADYVLDDTDNDGTTLLSAAVQMQDPTSIDYLIKKLMDVPEEILRAYLMKPGVAGRTVAHYLFNAPSLILRLGQHLPWEAKDKNGQTPVFALTRSYDHDMYRDMVATAVKTAQSAQQDGSKLHLDQHVDVRGNTLLHIAGEASVLKKLLKCDVQVNSVNEKGFTALMVACKYGRIEMAKALFADPRVDVLAKELRGLTAVELAKDDDVRNTIDDLVLFQNRPGPQGRVTAVVRSFFVEDASIRVVLKSAAPSAEEGHTFTVTTCRRSLSDFQFLAQWLQFENPASWLPALPGPRSPYQLPSKPSRAVLRDIQLRLDNFLRTLLSHPTFSSHELLWEFFLVPEIQQDLMIERSRKKAEARLDRIREEFTPVEDVREVEMFVSYAKDSVRGINISFRSVTRRATVIRTALSDLIDAHRILVRHLHGFKFISDTPHIRALTLAYEALIPNESHPFNLFLEDFRDVQASLSGVMAMLERPKVIIAEMSTLQKQIDKHMVSLRRSDRWPLGLLDETRKKMQREAEEKVRKAREAKRMQATELRYTQSVAAGELAAFHTLHEQQARDAVRRLARRCLVVERERWEGLKRALRTVKSNVRQVPASP